MGFEDAAQVFVVGVLCGKALNDVVVPHLPDISRLQAPLTAAPFRGTFGEYLVARFTWHILNNLHVSESSRHHRVSGAQPDDSHLHALLSLTPLTSSNSVIDFLIELAGTSDQRDSLLKLTSAILALSQHGRPRTTEAYQLLGPHRACGLPSPRIGGPG